jgi:hypothetical protein
VSEKISVKLDHPITLPDRELTEVTLRRIKVKDNLSARKQASDDAEREIVLLGKLSGLNQEDIGELDMSDYSKLQEALLGFLSSTHKTPAKGS